jgi:hypothetical protein
MSLKTNEIVFNKHKIYTKNLSIKRKQNNFVIRDKNINYIIDKNKLICPCFKLKNELCVHIIHILYNEYKLSEIIIKFYHNLLSLFHEIKNIHNYDNIKNILEEYIIYNILDYDCGICTNKLDSKDYLYECISCKKYCHNLCLDKWIKKSTCNKSTCIYCRFPIQ